MSGCMQTEMLNAEALTGQWIAEFLKGSEGIAFTGGDRASIYAWTEYVLGAQEDAGKDEEGAGREPQVCVQGHGSQPAADDKAAPQPPGDGANRGEAEPEV